MYPPVLTKKDFVRRYEAGEFGNHSPTWNTLEGFIVANWQHIDPNQHLEDAHPSLFHVRNRVAGGKTWYNCAAWYVAEVYRLAELEGIHSDSLYISAMAPTEQTLFQGEVMRGIWGLELTYTTVAKPMRDALCECTKVARGVIANSLLRHFLCSNSYNWLEVLLDRYPDHAVEFSTYAVEWGTLPCYNTVFWEVRKY